MTRKPRYRWRTRIRRRLPWFLIDRGFMGKGRHDCGAHEWYRTTKTTAHCYHCVVGVGPWPPDEN